MRRNIGKVIETCNAKFPKVVFYANFGSSKGYGSVKFDDDNERSQTTTQMFDV